MGTMAILGFSGISLLFVSIFGFVIYFIPSIVAYHRKHLQFIPILLLNIFLGWTLLGWVGAFVWSFMNSSTSTNAGTGSATLDASIKSGE